MAIDGKYGRVTLEHGSIPADEPVVVFRAKDIELPTVLAFYHALCQGAGSPQRHLDLIERTRATVLAWQAKHETKVPRQRDQQKVDAVIEAVGFDLDSTIANTYHRQWMVPAILAKGEGAPTWDDYSMACANDTPIEGTVALMRMLSSAGHLIFIITGRSAGAEALTRHWLNQHHIPCDALVMRPAGDHTANGKFKVAQIRRSADLGYQIVLFVEDWPEAAEYITKHTGIPCLLVNANYPADAPHQNENSKSV